MVEAVLRDSKDLIWLELIEQEPDAGLGNGGLGRLAACFLDSLATMRIPAMGYGLRYEYGIFRQTIKDGWQVEQPGQLAAPARPVGGGAAARKGECALNCSFEMRGGDLRAVAGQPSDLIGIPYRPARDRLRRQDHQHAPAVGRGARRIISISRNSAAAISSARWPKRSRPKRSRACCIPTTPRAWARGCASCRNISSWPVRWPTSCAASATPTPTGSTLPDKVAIQLNDTHPTLAVPELMRILLDEAKLGWDEAWDLTQRTLAYTNHTLLPEALEKWPVRWFEMLLPRHLEIIYEINRRFLDDVRATISRRRRPRRSA